MATLPGVTQRQHRFAALAGGGVTLIAIGGFAALIAFAPTEPRIKDALVPPAPETALAMPPMDGRETSIERPAVAPSPEVDDLANIEDWPVADEPDPRVPLGESDTQAALSADSPRWADSTDGGEAAAEAMSGDDVATEAARPAVDSADASPDGRGAAPAEAVSEEEATDPSTTAAIGRSEDRPGRITQAVNLRSRPADEGKVLRVVPARAAVTVIGCDAWCEVEYEGTRGFVYKRFVR